MLQKCSLYKNIEFALISKYIHLFQLVPNILFFLREFRSDQENGSSEWLFLFPLRAVISALLWKWTKGANHSNRIIFLKALFGIHVQYLHFTRIYLIQGNAFIITLIRKHVSLAWNVILKIYYWQQWIHILN